MMDINSLNKSQANYVFSHVISQFRSSIYVGQSSNKDSKYIALKVQRHQTPSEKEEIDKSIEIIKYFHHPQIIEINNISIFFNEVEYIITEMPYYELRDAYIFLSGIENDFEKINILSHITYQSLEILSLLKQNQIVHNDFKFENILVKSRIPLQILLTDFHAAETIENDKKPIIFRGTIPYASPEYLQKLTHDYSSDIWSLGANIFAQIFGEFPFDIEINDDENSALYKIMNNKLVNKNKLAPEEAWECIEKMLVIDPKNRITVEEALKLKWFSVKKFLKHDINLYTQSVYSPAELENNAKYQFSSYLSFTNKCKTLSRSKKLSPKKKLIKNNKKVEFISFDDYGELVLVENIKTKELLTANLLYKDFKFYSKKERKCILKVFDNILQLNHPSIMKYVGFGAKGLINDTRSTLLMEFISNETDFTNLSQILYNNKDFSEVESQNKILGNERNDKKLFDDTKKLINIFGIASGMAYLHSKGIIHQDLKPSNIFEDENYHPKITNYNFANHIESINEICKKYTIPFYQAPEVLINKEHSKKSDVYSFGLVVYEIITNKKRFKELSRYEFISGIFEGRPPELKYETKTVYEDLIKRCSSYNSQLRPTFSEIVDELTTNKKYITEKIDVAEYMKYIKDFPKFNDNDRSKKRTDDHTDTDNKHDTQKDKNENDVMQDKKNKKFEKKDEEEEEEEEEEEKEEEEECIMNKEEEEEEELIEKPFLPECMKTALEKKGQLADLTKYEKLDFIGVGSYGQVYKIKHKTTKMIYASKNINNTINLSFIMNDQAKLLLNEVIIHSSLNHPSIPQFIGYSPLNFDKEHKPVIILEFIRNCSLHNILVNENILEYYNISIPGWDDTMKLINIYGIARCLSYLHSLDIIHRDIKPNNVLNDEYLFPKLCDFGFSIKLSDLANNSNNILGTISYVAPEILSEKGEYSKKSDVYSFGILVYEVISHKIAFNEIDNQNQLFYDVTHGKRPQRTNNIPDAYWNLIIKCWAQDTEKRPTFESIVNDLATNKNYITPNVNERKFHDYIKFIDDQIENNESSMTDLSKLFEATDVIQFFKKTYK